MTENPHHSTLTEAEKRERNIEAILSGLKTIASSLDFDDTLNATCRATVDLLNVSHSSLIMLTPEGDQGIVRAEYPEFGVRNLAFRFGGPDELKHLAISTEPVFIPDVRDVPELGSIRQFLLDLNIRSLLIVPVAIENKVLGYFTLDTVGQTRAYTDEEIKFCKIFAAQVAVAIKNAFLYEETKQRAEQLEAVGKTTLAITSRLDREAQLIEIVNKAVSLLRAKNGGIFEYFRGHRALTVIIDSSPGGRKKGVTLREGEGMAGRLVGSKERYMIVPNYSEWAGRAPVDDEKRPSGAVLEVRILWQGEDVGSLYVEDDVGREFTDEDVRLLILVADQAAIAIHNARLDRELTRERQANLESLVWAAQTLSGKLDPERVLQMIAGQAMRSLGGDSATIWPYDKGLDKFLPSDLVVVGLPETVLEEFRSIDPPSGGISRAVMNEGWLCVADVASADDEFMKSTPRTELLLRMGVKSFQGIALKVDEPVGVMYVNYNRAHRFTEEDQLSMQRLADLAALGLVIVRNAQLSEERKQKLHEQEVLVDLSKNLLIELSRQLPVELSEQSARTTGREKILQRAVTVACSVLKVECCSIVLPDKDGRLILVAQEGLTNVESGKTEIHQG